MLRKAEVEFPDVKKIKVAFVASKKKKLESVVDLFNENKNVSDVHVISRPHLKLLRADLAHDKLKQMGCKKLRPLIMDNV